MAGCIPSRYQLAPFCVVLVYDNAPWQGGRNDDRRNACVYTKWVVFVFSNDEARTIRLVVIIGSSCFLFFYFTLIRE